MEPRYYGFMFVLGLMFMSFTLILVYKAVEHFDYKHINAKIISVGKKEGVINQYGVSFSVNGKDILRNYLTKRSYSVDQNIEVMYSEKNEEAYSVEDFGFFSRSDNLIIFLTVLGLVLFFLFSLKFPEQILEHLNGETPPS